MSPILVDAPPVRVLAADLTADHLGYVGTTPPGVVRSQPPVTGILAGIRLYMSGAILLVTLEVSDDVDRVVRSRTVTAGTVVTLTDP